MAYPGNPPADEGRSLFEERQGSIRRFDDDDGDDGCCGPDNCASENRAGILCCVVILGIISIILLAFSFDVVKPTEWGIIQNGWTGTVYTNQVWPPGRHFVWLKNFFITFPAYRVNIEFSTAANANAPPVPGRTGRDANDPDSGGQPVTLSFAFQYKFLKDDVGKVYKEFGEQYEARYLLFARMAVSDVAQKYTPEKFWTSRDEVAKEMMDTMKKLLRKNGHCEVTGFQLLQVDFPTKYEDMITDIQLQVQYKLTSEYQQKVTNVLKNIDVMRAKTNAEITEIMATANAKAAVLVNNATAEGAKMQQDAKAKAYKKLQTDLELTNEEMLEYVKIRALTSRNSDANTVVGTAQPKLLFS
jgi:regulator of protease activity HflC (stomatin/prohibitin superfamily)